MTPDQELQYLRDWKAGAEGALLISYPPRTRGHTEAAYAAHKDEYDRRMTIINDPYCMAADQVADAILAKQANLLLASEAALAFARELAAWAGAFENLKMPDRAERVRELLRRHGYAHVIPEESTTP